MDEIEPHVKAHYVLSGIPEVQGGRVVVYQVTQDNVDLGPGVRVAVVDTHPQLDPLVQLALDELVTEYLLPRMPRGATWYKCPAS